jgi:hypothetical protein
MANDFDSDKVEVELMGTGGQVNELLDKNKLIKTPLNTQTHTRTHAHTHTRTNTRSLAWPGTAHHGAAWPGWHSTAHHSTAQHTTAGAAWHNPGQPLMRTGDAAYGWPLSDLFPHRHGRHNRQQGGGPPPILLCCQSAAWVSHQHSLHETLTTVKYKIKS